MVKIFEADRHSPEPLGSICRASDLAMNQWNETFGYPKGFDYRDLPEKERAVAHDWVCRQTRILLGQE